MIGAPPPLEGPRVTLDQASFRVLAAAGIFAIASGLSSGMLAAPGTGPATAYQPMGSGLSSSPLPPLALAGFGLAAAALWFIGLALFFKIRGDERRAKVFASLQDL